MNRPHSSRASSSNNQAAKQGKSISGASAAKRKLGDRIHSYFAHHKDSFRATVSRLLANKVQTAATSLVIAIAMALPALLLVTLANLEALGQEWDTKPKLTLYLNERAKPVAIDALIKTMDSDPRVEELIYISSEDALVEFERLSGFGSVLAGLDSNPLPAAIELTLTSDFRDVAGQQALAEEWQAQVIVDSASVDLQWVQRFIAITELARKVVLFLAVLLAFGALLATGNTIRLIIESRKEEIVVIKLVGGTNGFVRRPLLYTGGAYGFIGAVFAILVVHIVLLALAPGVERLAHSYQSSFDLMGLGFVASLQLLSVGLAVGWLGALLAVGRHLSDIEPK